MDCYKEKKSLKCIDRLRNYILSLCDITDREYDMLYSLEKEIMISEYCHQIKYVLKQ